MNKQSSFWFGVGIAATVIVLAIVTMIFGQRLSDTELQRFGSVATAVAAVVGFVGLMVLLAYTRESFLLRKTAEDQNENSIKPVVTVEISTTDVELGQPISFGPFILKNIGTGPAFNVTAKPIAGTDIEMTIPDIALLEVNAVRDFEFSILQGGQPCGRQLVPALLRDHLQKGKFPAQMTVELEFDALSGRRYRTLHQVSYDFAAKRVRTKFRKIEML